MFISAFPRRSLLFPASIPRFLASWSFSAFSAFPCNFLVFRRPGHSPFLHFLVILCLFWRPFQTNKNITFFVLSLFAISFLANRVSSVFKYLCSAVVVIFGVSMGIYAGSRGALLAFVCSFLIVFFASRFNKLWALAPLLFSIYLLTQFDPSDLVGRLSEAGSDTNSVSRLFAIRESIRAFLAHPLLGAGFGYHLELSASVGYPQMWYPHNFIFESLALGGLLLTLPLITCIFLAIRSCVDSLKDSSASQLWRIAILVQALGYVAFSGHLSNVPLFWIALGLASSLAPQRIAKINP